MIRLRNALSECEDDNTANGKVNGTANGDDTSRSRTASTNKDPRPRKNTLTSLNSDLKTSHGNLASQTHKMSANSIAQSLTQLNNKRQPSNLSIALAVILVLSLDTKV